MKISRETRRNILDWLAVEGTAWNGRLTEEAFLDRVVDLDTLPSTDPRFSSARGDIRQHRFNNDDWTDDWVFSYEPLSLLATSDDVFAQFLAEMLHPVVRPDSETARLLAQELNDFLRGDQVGLVEVSTIGARPVWDVRPAVAQPGLTAALRPGVQADAQPLRIWDLGLFRLFLSHVSAHKIQVASLKSELATYGVSGFVAHEDIEPSREWQSEIEYAMSTMHALVALLTSDFHASKWTDHEVGYALGRQAFVLSVRLPENPYGFLGKHQALRGDLAQPVELASAIVDVLLRRDETVGLMREGLTRALEAAPNFQASKAISMKIVATAGFSPDQLRRIEAAISANDQVANSYGVPRRLRHYLADSRPT